VTTWTGSLDVLPSKNCVGAGAPEPSEDGVVEVLPSKKSVGCGSPGVGNVVVISSDAVAVVVVLPSKNCDGARIGVNIEVGSTILEDSGESVAKEVLSDVVVSLSSQNCVGSGSVEF